jgi:hypothetical protein
MKLPRWLVTALLVTSTLTALATAADLWVTWPARTADRFTDLIRRNSFQDLSTMIKWRPGTTSLYALGQTYLALACSENLDDVVLIPEHRRLSDFAIGRQRFAVTEPGRTAPVCRLRVERGWVAFEQ